MSTNGKPLTMRRSVAVGSLLLDWQCRACSCMEGLSGSHNYCPVHSAAGQEKIRIVQGVVAELVAQEEFAPKTPLARAETRVEAIHEP